MPLSSLQVGNHLYVQLPDATAVVPSNILSIQPLTLATSFNPHTLLSKQYCGKVHTCALAVDLQLALRMLLSILLPTKLSHGTGLQATLWWMAWWPPLSAPPPGCQ